MRLGPAPESPEDEGPGLGFDGSADQGGPGLGFDGEFGFGGPELSMSLAWLEIRDNGGNSSECSVCPEKSAFGFCGG